MDVLRRIFRQNNTKSEYQSARENSSTDSPKPDTVLASHLATFDAPISDGATRPLPPETVISSSNEHLTFGQATDVGMVRTNNQDAVFSFLSTSRSSQQRPDFGLFIVADGMGGHHDGEKASALTVELVAAYITDQVFIPTLSNDDRNDRVPITEAMIKAIEKANAMVINKVPDGGTTLTATVVIGDLAYVAHVGDSRVYLVTRDGIEQITRDHSLVQRLIELEQLTREEANSHPQKNVLYRALGQSDTLEVDALTRRLPPNSQLMLCSDGLWNLISEAEIVEVITKYPDPQEACDKLVALANAHGGTDNITTTLIRVATH